MGEAQPFPFRWYATSVFDTDELTLRLLFAEPVTPQQLHDALSSLPVASVVWLDDPATLSERDEYDALPEPGQLRAWTSGPWLALYLNLGDPSDPSEDLAMFKDVFVRFAVDCPIVEVVEGHGNLRSFPEDGWTEWSLAQTQPTKPPDEVLEACITPYDDPQQWPPS